MILVSGIIAAVAAAGAKAAAAAAAGGVGSALATGAAVAGAGVGIASAAGAFDPDAPLTQVPTPADPAIKQARLLRRFAAGRRAGRTSTIRTGPEGVDPGSDVLARPQAAGPGGPGGL